MEQNNDSYEMIRQLAAAGESGAFDWLEERSRPFLELMCYYKCAMMEVETKFNVLNEEYAFAHDRNPISSIKTRLKRFGSIKEKMLRKGIPQTMQAIERELNDIAGMRVICSFPQDVYMLAEALLKQDDIRLIQKKERTTSKAPSPTATAACTSSWRYLYSLPTSGGR